MDNTSVGRLIITVLGIGLAWLTIYLINQKLHNPDAGFTWGAPGFTGFLALIFLALSALAWFGVYVERKFVEVDADFRSVHSEGTALNQAGDTLYYWHFTCQWNDSNSGKIITAKSPSFEGKRLYYNRHKILVRCNPKSPEVLPLVDVSFLTAENQDGIPVVGENEVKAAVQYKQIVVQQRQNSPLGIMLLKFLDFYKRNKLWFIVGQVLFYLIIGVLLVWRIWKEGNY